jgi:hypothetical protein
VELFKYKNKLDLMENFFRTQMGRKLLETDVPKLVKILEKIAEQMETANIRENKKFLLQEKLMKRQMKDINEKGN